MKKGNFIQIDNNLTLNKNISDKAFRIYCYLKTHHLAVYSPNYKQIMKDMSCSKKTVYRALCELKDANLIIVCKTEMGYLKIQFN